MRWEIQQSSLGQETPLWRIVDTLRLHARRFWSDWAAFATQVGWLSIAVSPLIVNARSRSRFCSKRMRLREFKWEDWFVVEKRRFWLRDHAWCQRSSGVFWLIGKGSLNGFGKWMQLWGRIELDFCPMACHDLNIGAYHLKPLTMVVKWLTVCKQWHKLWLCWMSPLAS